MIQIGYGMFVFAVIRFMVSFVNWISRSYLPRKYTLGHTPFVSVLIPARNEEKNISKLLRDLASVKYPSMEILVYNDSSTDNTAGIVKEFVSHHTNIRLIEGSPLPEGWMGKNFACHQLASLAKGDWLLFLDADVRINPLIIEKSIAYADKHQLKLLSIFPTQIMPSPGSKLVVPIMNWILLSLLPLPLIRLSGWSSLSAANGQFMFFRSEEYRNVLPHKLFRNNQVEDIVINREYKRRKMKVATLLGANDIHCKMYSGLQEGIEGFSKNVFQFFGGSGILTVLFALITTLAPFWLFLFNTCMYGLIYLAMIVAIHVLVSLSSSQSVVNNVLLIIPQQLVFWRIILSAFVKLKNKTLTWKDRNISSVS